MIVHFTKPGADCRDSWCSTLLVVGRGRGSHPCSWSASLWSTARRASSDSLFILHLRDPLLKIWKFVDEHFSCLTFCSGKICKCRHFHWRSCMWNGLEHFPQIVYFIITKHDRGLTDQYVIFVNVLIKLPTDGSTSPIVILGPHPTVISPCMSENFKTYWTSVARPLPQTKELMKMTTFAFPFSFKFIPFGPDFFAINRGIIYFVTKTPCVTGPKNRRQTPPPP